MRLGDSVKTMEECDIYTPALGSVLHIVLSQSWMDFVYEAAYGQWPDEEYHTVYQQSKKLRKQGVNSVECILVKMKHIYYIVEGVIHATSSSEDDGALVLCPQLTLDEGLLFVCLIADTDHRDLHFLPPDFDFTQENDSVISYYRSDNIGRCNHEYEPCVQGAALAAPILGEKIRWTVSQSFVDILRSPHLKTSQQHKADELADKLVLGEEYHGIVRGYQHPCNRSRSVFYSSTDLLAIQTPLLPDGHLVWLWEEDLS